MTQTQPRRIRFHLALWLSIAALPALGCSSSSFPCSDGMVYDGEECITPPACGSGTVMVGGQCIPVGDAPDGSFNEDGGVDGGTDAGPVIVSCGPGTGDNGDGVCVPDWELEDASLEKSVRLYSRRVCQKYADCCDGIDAPSLIEFIGDRRTCEPLLFEALYDPLDDLLDSIDEGRSEINTSYFAEIDALFASEGCDVTLAEANRFVTNPIPELATPVLADGMDCEDDWECTSGVCSNLGLGGDTTCVVPGTAGADCGRNDDCATGFYCNANMCTAQGISGIACGSNTECADGLSCFTNTCRPVGSSGFTCDDRADCNADQYCDSGACTVGMEGDSCEDTDECNQEMVCTPATVGSEILSCQDTLNFCVMVDGSDT